LTQDGKASLGYLVSSNPGNEKFIDVGMHTKAELGVCSFESCPKILQSVNVKQLELGKVFS
jgi:hypothetical protein